MSATTRSRPATPDTAHRRPWPPLIGRYYMSLNQRFALHGGALIVAVYAASAYRLRAQASNLRALSDGERAVRSTGVVSTLAFSGCTTSRSETANVDHFPDRGALDLARLRRKPNPSLIAAMQGSSRRREKFWCNVPEMSRNPSAAKAQARWLSGFFGEAQVSGVRAAVRGFPGWFFEPFYMKREGFGCWSPKRSIDSFRTARTVSPAIRSRRWPPLWSDLRESSGA